MVEQEQNNLTATTESNLPATSTQFEDVDKILNALDNVDDEQLTAQDERECLTFDTGDVVNFLFEGTEVRTFGEEGEKLCANFTGKENKKYYCGNAYLVNRLKNYTEPLYVRIKYTGEQKANNGGKFKTFEIFHL